MSSSEGGEGVKVSAAQAGWLVHRNERQVRERIRRGDLRATPAGASAKREGSGPSRWAISTDDLARIPGWAVDASRLAQLVAQQRAQPDTLAARVAALELQVNALQRQIARLRLSASQGDAPAPTEDVLPPTFSDSPLSATLVQQDRYPSGYTGGEGAYEAHRRVSVNLPSAPGAGETFSTFRTRADASRWLARHGVNEATPKSWPGWREVDLTPAAVLALAISLQEPGNWRKSWRLHRCGDPACVCGDLLLADG